MTTKSANWRNLVAACAAISVFGFAIGMSYPLLSLILESRGVSPELIGINSAMSPIGILLSASIIPIAARKFGSRNLAVAAAEIDQLLVGTKSGRHGVRNHLLVMMMYRHGLRVSEAITIRTKDIDLKRSRLWVRRLKNGLSVEQPIPGDELRAIKRYLKQREDRLPWLFISEREQAMTRRAVNYIVENAANRAGLDPVNSHMLRHSCGFYLADQGYDLRLIQDYLGHRDPKHTVHYTRVAGSRFEGLWASS